MKYFRFVFLVFVALSLNIFAQKVSNLQSVSNDLDIQRILVEKGQTLNDFINPEIFSKTQTDIDPGIPPEGDFMLRSSFTTDGNKVLVCTGGTDNISVFDVNTMEVIEIIAVGNYPCDIACTDDYAIIPCIFGDEIYVIDLSDYSIAATFTTPAGSQPVVVEVSPDGNFAYVACDINDQCEVIDLQSLTQLTPITNFPIALLTFSWVSTGGRSSFKFTRFAVSSDGDHLIVGNADNEVLFINALSGEVDYSISEIPNCFVVGLSGDGQKTVALSDYNSELNAYQIDNTTHEIITTVSLSGNYLACYDVAVNNEGTKAFIGIGNNSSAIVRFATQDYVSFAQTYTPFWMTTTYDHQYAVSGQYRFSIMDFETESMVDQLQGYTQDFGCVSPVDYKVIGYDPLRYEGVYFFDISDPSNIMFSGRALVGLPPEADTPYRISISADGTKAITSNSISESMTIIDLSTYSVAEVLDMGEKSDATGITYDSQVGILGGYDLNTIKLVDLNTHEFITSVTCGQRPLMIDVSLDDQYAYIGNLKGNSVSIVELDGVNSNEIVEIPTGTIGLSWAAFGVRSAVVADPTDQYILVAASFDDKVQVIDIAQQQIVAEMSVGSFPLKIAFNATGEYACVTNYNSDNYSIMYIDGASSFVIGTYPCGDGPLRIAYNSINDEFGIINYSDKKIINIDPQTGDINSTDYYTQYGNPIQVKFDNEGNPIVLVIATTNDPGYLIRKDEVITLPATPTYFDYCLATHTAVVCMPGPDYVTVVEFDQVALPNAEFIANVTTIQEGETVDFTDMSLNNPTSWEWDFEGGEPLVSTEQNPTITYNVEGVYDVTLTATNDLGSDEELKADYITVLPFVYTLESEATEMKVFPNPVKDFLQIQTKTKAKEVIHISIFNAMGKLLFVKQYQDINFEIDFTDFTDGLYFVKIKTGDNTQRIKILKRT
jgi:YVTN family beta-propeller protein